MLLSCSTALDRRQHDSRALMSLSFLLASLRIPLDTIGQHGIVKLDLAFGPVLHNFSIDIGSLFTLIRTFASGIVDASKESTMGTIALDAASTSSISKSRSNITPMPFTFTKNPSRYSSPASISLCSSPTIGFESRISNEINSRSRCISIRRDSFSAMPTPHPRPATFTSDSIETLTDCRRASASVQPI